MPVRVIMAVLTPPMHVEDGHARCRIFADNLLSWVSFVT